MIPVLNKYKDDIPKHAKYIGRPTKWGNHYKIGVDGTREEVVRFYREWAFKVLDRNPNYFSQLIGATALVCYCAPLPCHGDVIAEILEKRYG